jgi:hypothetical protein
MTNEAKETGNVAREAIVTLALLRSTMKAQAEELQAAMRAEVRNAGEGFKQEAHAASATLNRKLEDMIAKADRAVDDLAKAQSAFSAQRRRLFWGLGSVVLLCLISLVATYEGLYGFYQARYDMLVRQVTYLDAVNRADVVPCGEGRLCARVDDKAPRIGDKKQYRPVELRQ